MPSRTVLLNLLNRRELEKEKNLKRDRPRRSLFSESLPIDDSSGWCPDS